MNLAPHYDIAAISIFILIASCVFLRHLNRSRSSKVFLGLIIVCILAAIFDLISIYLVNNFKTANILSFDPELKFTYAMHFMHFALRYSVPFVYSMYLLSFVQSFKNLKRTIIYVLLLGIPYSFLFGVFISNYYTHLAYNLFIVPDGALAGNLVYKVGTFMQYTTYYEVYYFVFITYVLFRYRKLFTISQLISLFMIIPISVLTIIFKVKFHNTVIELLFLSLPLLLIVQNVESPELLIDYKTGLSSEKQFEFAIKKEYLFRLNSKLILLDITNYAELYTLFDIDSANKYVKKISSTLDSFGLMTYSLGEGLYAIIIETSGDSSGICNDIYDSLKRITLKNIDIVLSINICYIDIRKDFINELDLQEFIVNFRDNNFEGIIIYGNEKDKKEFNIKRNIDSIIEEAFRLKEFKVYYQPIFNVKKNRFTYAEALIRIESPTYGLIYPINFIPYLEMSGAINKVDLLVIEEVMMLLNRVDVKKYGLNTISINLSLVDFNSQEFIENIIKLKEKYKVDSKMIKFEITESKDIEFDDSVFEKIDILRELGFEFMLDDYGIGYSNLERFAKLPIEYVKVDRELVKLADEYDARDTLKNTFDMIYELNRKSVVEGIESKEEYNNFLKYNCNYVQGFYFSEALKEQDLFDYLEDSNSVS